MASYGRLEIYRPESTVESFILSKDITAIGRQTGNDLIIDRNGISRYHAVLKVESNKIMLEDLESVNGTYIDGTRLNANEPRELRGGEEVQVGDVRMVFYPPELISSTSEIKTDLKTQHIETPKIMLHITGLAMIIVPGSNAQASILLENSSTETERYKLSVEGVPQEWVRLERHELELSTGQQIQLRASFKPLRRSDSRPGDYPISFIVEPQSDPDAKITVESILQIGIFSGYGVAMGTPTVEGDNPFQMHVHNHGNGPLNVSFRGVDPANALDFEIDPEEALLAGGERRTIIGKVIPKQGKLFGDPREYNYDIISLAHDASGFQAAVAGKYTSKPMFPAWVPTMAIPAVALIMIAVIVGVIMLLGGDEKAKPIVPIIQAFDAANQQTEVVLGDPVILEWDVQDARSVTIMYARPEQPPQEIKVENADAQTYQLILDSSGVYTITLLVENTGGEANDVMIASVLPRITTLEADPAVLLRGVAQDVEIAWAFSGANTLDNKPDVVLSSPDVSVIQSAGLPADGSETYTILPQDSVSIQFLVRGHDGTENSRTLLLAIEDPRCILSNPNATIYTGPDQVYDEVAVIDEEGFTVNPLARNAENTWLQVMYGDELAWVRVADFACEDFQIEQLDPNLDIPPTPRPPATPTVPPATPAPTEDVSESN